MKAILSDNDGTLVGTESVTVPHLLDRIRLVTGGAVDIDMDSFFMRYHGMGGRVLTDAIGRDHGCPIDYEAVYGNRIAEVESLLRDARVPVAPNALASLQAFHDAGWEVAVVSNEPARRGVTALSNTPDGSGSRILALAKDRYFEAGQRRKPDPEVYVRAADALGIDPADCIAVEDSKAGVAAAVAAGIPCFGYIGLAREVIRGRIANELAAAGAIAVLEDWADIARAVLSPAREEMRRR